MFVRPVLHLDQHAWTEAHVAAFRYFGGVPRRLVPDNLKTGVDKPDLYDPKINKAHAELATHYGALVDPARAAKPKDKPRVERPMPDVRDSFWRGREFTSIEHMQAEAVTWSQQVAGRLIRCRGVCRLRGVVSQRALPMLRSASEPLSMRVVSSMRLKRPSGARSAKT